MSRPSLPRVLASTGWVVSGLSLAAILLTVGFPTLVMPLALILYNIGLPPSITPLTAAIELACVVGAAVGIGVTWTLLQAMIHTRLGSREMWPDAVHAGDEPPISWRRMLGVSAALVVLGRWRCSWRTCS